ncbi:hypothetical protein GGH12_001638 [Coemansia sp. RSA 1822]|nr:hypothetical protein LPJ76_001738 [Coemansia sp. RSA 638]KAJ2538293.1 hypothetical protein GGF49_006001 [Coemansia sp. RSA 1853]KAJ2565097.1 hypothetical protein GGH12_001638 [Coemansia sp. RSA 1822]
MVITSGADGPANTPTAGHIHNARDNAQPEAPRRPTVCRFFSQPQGCRFGSDCRFLHIASTPTVKPTPKADALPKVDIQPADSEAARSRGRGRGRKARSQQSSTVRKRQIEDLLKAPQWTVKRLASDRNESALAVEMKPSDPDFPFDVHRLYLALVVPSQYPAKYLSDPVLTIQVANQKIPTGVKRNIEQAFVKHVRKAVNAAIEQGDYEGGPTLEDHLVWLDRNLELLMQQKPAPTIKFTSNASSKAVENKAAESKAESPDQHSQDDNDQASTQSSTPVVSVPNTTAAQRASRPVVSRPVPKPVAIASSSAVATSGSNDTRRSIELRQLERRFRSSFTTLQDGANSTVIKLDIVPTDPEIHDFDIFQLTSTMTVARTYPLPDGQTPSVVMSLDANSFVGRKGKASSWQPVGGRVHYLEHISRRFAEHVAEMPAVSLLQHLNWLDRWLVSMVAHPPPPPPASDQHQPSAEHQSTVVEPEAVPEDAPKQRIFEETEDKPWIRRITPAEAGLSASMGSLTVDSQNSSSDTDSDFDSSSDEAELATDGAPFSKPARRGIEIRLGSVNTTNVSLMHCHSLCLGVRCVRCKSAVEIKGIVPTLRTDQDHQMWKTCDTCSTVVGVRFRPDWMFNGSSTLGYLDCSGCVPTDLLPSKLTLSCEACVMADPDADDAQPRDTLAQVGVASTSSLNCRSCYARMSVQLHEPQFVKLQAGLKMGGDSSAAQISKAVKRKVSRREEMALLGVVPGQPLPKTGACKHFGRSHRWMRFPCCGKTYPCVTCHDDNEDHDHEYAQSMLCGFCAKEQRISKAEQTGLCISCGAQVIKKVDGNNAFWQGGKGVRDRTRMSRKDSKKFQGLGKTVALKNVTTPKK